MAQPDRTPQLPPEVARAIQQGNLLEAVKLLRKSTGLGLKEAKDLLGKPSRAPLPPPPSIPDLLPTGLPIEAQQALRRGHKLEAIRIVREKTGADLKRAKDAVDAFERSSAPPRKTTSPSGRRLAPGEVPPESNLPVLIALVALIVFGAWLFL